MHITEFTQTAKEKWRLRMQEAESRLEKRLSLPPLYEEWFELDQKVDDLDLLIDKATKSLEKVTEKLLILNGRRSEYTSLYYDIGVELGEITPLED